MTEPLRLYRWADAPPALQGTSDHGGGEVLLAVVPARLARRSGPQRRCARVRCSLIHLASRLSAAHAARITWTGGSVHCTHWPCVACTSPGPGGARRGSTQASFHQDAGPVCVPTRRDSGAAQSPVTQGAPEQMALVLGLQPPLAQGTPPTPAHGGHDWPLQQVKARITQDQVRGGQWPGQHRPPAATTDAVACPGCGATGIPGLAPVAGPGRGSPVRRLWFAAHAECPTLLDRPGTRQRGMAPGLGFWGRHAVIHGDVNRIARTEVACRMRRHRA